MRDTREVLGTFVTVTAYGDDTAAIRRAVDNAFAAIEKSEAALSAYPDTAATLKNDAAPPPREVSSVAEFNRDPFTWHRLPGEAAEVLDRLKALGVEDSFSPGMLRITAAYGFGSEDTVPDPAYLDRLVHAAKALETSRSPEGVDARFGDTGMPVALPVPAWSSYAPPSVGLDLSGAAKGAALDAALRSLEDAAGDGTLDGALISAGSTTLVAGRKTTGDGEEPWSVGVEDPRDPEKVIAIVEYSSADEGGPGTLPLGTVSTSGDYQQSFVRDGVRYHHILDPDTGKPAREMRSLTVVGAPTGLDSDILSTALFVMGIDRAEAYAKAHGLGLFIVDAEGRTRIVPGPSNAEFSIRLAES